MRSLLTVFFLSTVFGIGGCFSTPKRNVVPGAVLPHRAESRVSEARAAEFRNITVDCAVRGIVLHPEAFENRYTVTEVVEAVKKLGFNRVYCAITTEKTLNDHLTALLRAFGENGLPVEILISQRDYYRKYHTNQLLRSILAQYPTLSEAAAGVVRYNRSLPEDVKKLAGLTIVAEPHFFSDANVERSHGLLYSWGEKRYGIGKDNDMLMRNCLAELKNIAAMEEMLPLTIGTYDFYHDKAVAGELSCGKVSDFRKFGKVMVINTGNLPSAVVKNLNSELKDSGDRPVLVAVQLAGHTSEQDGALRRRNWSDFCRALRYAGKEFRNHRSFNGFVVSPLAVIEFLRQER